MRLNGMACRFLAGVDAWHRATDGARKDAAYWMVHGMWAATMWAAIDVAQCGGGDDNDFRLLEIRMSAILDVMLGGPGVADLPVGFDTAFESY